MYLTSSGDKKNFMSNENIQLISTKKQKRRIKKTSFKLFNNKTREKKLEKAFGLERFQASQKIIKKNEEIEKKIKQYETNIRNRNVY